MTKKDGCFWNHGGGDDALAFGGRNRRHRAWIYAQLVVRMVDLGFNRAAGGDHDLDVYYWAGPLPPAAQNAWHAIPGGQQGDVSPGSRAGWRELCTNRENKTSLNDAGGLWGICGDYLADYVQTFLGNRLILGLRVNPRSFGLGFFIFTVKHVSSSG